MFDSISVADDMVDDGHKARLWASGPDVFVCVCCMQKTPSGAMHDDLACRACVEHARAWKLREEQGL